MSEMVLGRQIATFWSIENLPCMSRYHLGQLSIAQYADTRVRNGGIHWAIICDSDALSVGEYGRIHEIASAIDSMCAEPVVVRTLTSFRTKMSSRDRLEANELAARVARIRRSLQTLSTAKYSDNATEWRRGQIDSSTFLATLPEQAVRDLRNVSDDELAGFVYLLTKHPKWYEDYWFASTRVAINQLASEIGGPIEIVEGERNRYVWLALRALDNLSVVSREKPNVLNATLSFRPNVEADGSLGFMCLRDVQRALLVHSSRERILGYCEFASERVAESIRAHLLGGIQISDRRNLGLEIANLLATVQERWIFSSEQRGPMREVPRQAARRTEQRGVVVSVHGVMSRGTWQKDFSEYLSAESFVYVPEDFGYLLPLAVLRKSTTVKFSQKLADNFNRLGERYPHAPLSVVAHSFGTLVLGAVLENYPDLRVDKVVLSGCILPPSFPWAKYLNRDQVGCVVNLVSTSDWTIRITSFLAQCGFKQCGASGSQGFIGHHSRIVQPLSRDFGHSDWFTKIHFSRCLLPLLLGDAKDAQAFYSGYDTIDGPPDSVSTTAA
jgi:pimeloyl-ACP methyl ester carboxylesterase